MVILDRFLRKKVPAGLISACVLFPLLLAPAEELLNVRASISPRRLRRKQEGKVVLKISLRDDIDISSQPFFTIELMPSDELRFPKNFFSASDLEIEIIEKEGKEYLDLKDPIEIPFSVKMEARRGNHSLKGKIKHFACSKEDDWCLKSTTEFSAGFYTSSRIYEKRK